MAYHFPPRGGGGVMRAVKFVKYLPEFGWQPAVVAAHPAVYERELLDPTLVAEIGDTPVSRPWYPGAWIYLSPARAPQPFRATVPGAPVGLRRRGVSWTLRYLELPWVVPAFFAVRRAHRVSPADAVLTTSPPGWAHLVGYLAKRLLGIPWVMDFRDQWCARAPVPIRGGASRLERRLELACVSTADAVATATPEISAHYGGLRGRDDVLTITNGYDAEDFRGPNAAYPACFTVCYVGTLGHEYDPTGFLTAWREFLARRRLDAHGASCRFVGHSSRIDFERGIGVDEPLRSSVRFFGFVDHARARREMEGASVLLVLLNHDRVALTAKLFEYVGARKPILAVAPEGALTAFVRQRGLGWAARPDDRPGIVAALERLHDLHLRGALDSVVRSRGDTGCFERRPLTASLSQLLERAAKASR